MPVLTLCLTTVGSFAVLFLSAKLIGHKQIAQLDFFDYITGITIGSIAAEMATELEEPWKPLLAMVIYGGITLSLSLISSRFPRSRKYLNGTPTILLDHGKLYYENMKKARLDLSEFLVLCRQQGYFDLTTIQTAIFEYNGKLTILPVTAQRPVTPQDLDLNPDQELTFTELIMDGRILEDNLKRMGLDRTWLEKQLKQRHISTAKEVFLAVCDRNLKFVLFKK
ncbi:MAG TPA: DUF421 domain-containing protein [Candidatus Enterenecus avicola]|nr:DUF421 domain-containing protein [Candidatus Enterenecus avicola]